MILRFDKMQLMPIWAFELSLGLLSEMTINVPKGQVVIKVFVIVLIGIDLPFEKGPHTTLTK